MASLSRIEAQGGISKMFTSSLISELLNFQYWIKIASFNVRVRYFVWNFKGSLWNSTQNILPIHWKMCRWLKIYELLDLRAHTCFWNAPKISCRYSCVEKKHIKIAKYCMYLCNNAELKHDWCLKILRKINWSLSGNLSNYKMIAELTPITF